MSQFTTPDYVATAVAAARSDTQRLMVLTAINRETPTVYLSENLQKALDFGRPHVGPQARAKAVLANMADNDGLFVP